jgi:hypothetical protein
MEYLLLEYQDAALQDGRSDSECRSIMEACRDNDRALRESGCLVLAATLHSSAPMTVVSIHNSVVSVSDTEVPLSGIYLIHARDMNDAIRTVRSMPQTRLGTIEIRSMIRVAD